MGWLLRVWCPLFGVEGGVIAPAYDYSIGQFTGTLHKSSQNLRVARGGCCEADRVELTPEEAAEAIGRYDCPTCEVMAPSSCRTRGGKVALKYQSCSVCLVRYWVGVSGVVVRGRAR